MCFAILLQRGMTEEEKGREKNGKTARNQEVSLTWIMYTPFPPQKGNPLGQTEPFSCPWPEGRRCRGAARTPAHSPPFSNEKDNTLTYREPARGQKHDIPTQMGGMDVVIIKGKFLQSHTQTGCEYYKDSSVLSCLSRDGSND